MLSESEKREVKTLSLGWIPYWNLHPMRKELLRKKHGEIDFKLGHPAKVNNWLSDGTVAMAPCSSICLLKNPKAEIAVPAGVAARGAVQSVYLGFQQEHSQLFEILRERREQAREWFLHARSMHGFDVRKISQVVWKASTSRSSIPLSLAPRMKLTSASETSVKLTQILYRLWFGREAYEINCERDLPPTSAFGNHSPVELVIGDEALSRKRSFYRTLDLGAAWHEMTGLPVVFAVWQSQGEFLNGWRRVILDCAELAEARMKVEPTAYIPDTLPVDDQGKQIKLAEYWKSIHYKLGADDFKGLSLFLSLARDFTPGKYDESVLAKMMRWQDLGIKGNFSVI
jgi:predicted solute-binding protein